jgi:hypothetical protein
MAEGYKRTKCVYKGNSFANTDTGNKIEMI